MLREKKQGLDGDKANSLVLLRPKQRWRLPSENRCTTRRGSGGPDTSMRWSRPVFKAFWERSRTEEKGRSASCCSRVSLCAQLADSTEAADVLARHA